MIIKSILITDYFIYPPLLNDWSQLHFTTQENNNFIGNNYGIIIQLRYWSIDPINDSYFDDSSFSVSAIIQMLLTNIIKLIAIQILVHLVLTYKEFTLTKSFIITPNNHQCTTFSDSNSQHFSQLCYQKDISYRADLYIDDTLYYVAFDLTVPFSWLKSPECKTNPNADCSIIRDQDKRKMEKEFADVRMEFKLFGDQKHGKNEKKAEIAGSTDRIQGKVENQSNADFYAKDSKTMRQFLKIVQISLFMASQKDLIHMTDVSFIKAEKLSLQANELSDGAISLRPQKMIQNAFLKSLFSSLQSSNKTATIYLNPQRREGIVSFGEVSLKYSKSQASQIDWVPMKYNEQYGYAVPLNEIFLGDDSKQKKNSKNFTKHMNTYFTTSSSNIFLPSEILTYLSDQLLELSNADCSWSKTAKFTCSWQVEADKEKLIPLSFFFKFNQLMAMKIPILTLINMSKQKIIQFTIYQSHGWSQVILGEPIFQKYLIFIDYKDNRLGFTPSFVHYSQKYSTMLIYFLRLIFLINFLLIIVYLCFKPLNSLIKTVSRIYEKRKTKLSKHVESYDQLPQTQLKT